MYGKLIEGSLVTIKDVELTKRIFENNTWKVINKTAEELSLEGWKNIIYSEQPIVDIYHYLSPSYVETDTTITVNYTIEHISPEETLALNTAFWEENYYQIMWTGTPRNLNYYVSKHSYTSDGRKCDLINDDLFKIVTGAQQMQLEYLEVISDPDLTQDLTSEYLLSITIEEENIEIMQDIIGYLFQLSYEQRTVQSMA